jgi:hypothetical protein
VNERSSVRELILVPAIVTLAVTLLRLTGELLNWSPRLFSREAGGAGAIVGIVWLVFVFGAYFGWKLARAGQGPGSPWKAAGLALAAFALVVASIVAMQALKLQNVAAIASFVPVSLAAAAVAYRGWPALGKVLLAYGVSARIPVAIVMLIAIHANWGTHYELGPPGFPEMAPLIKWFWIGLLPQMTLWIMFTMVVGGLCGAVAAAIARSRPA